MFLFYEDKKKQWLVGPTLGATKGVNFSTTEKTLAKCPGDPPASGTWQRKSTILGRWVSIFLFKGSLTFLIYIPTVN